MSHYKQHTSKPNEMFVGYDTDSRVYMELVLGHSAAKAARDQGCSSMNIEALAHAQRALAIARGNSRPDLEEKAQLGKAEFLLIMGRKSESLEVEILVAAKAENMEIEQRQDGSIASVGGVPMDELTRRLMDNEVGKEPSSCPSFVCQHKTDIGGDTEKKSGPRSIAGSSAPSDTVWNNTTQGRRVRDVRGQLITTTSVVPVLRRKPAFVPL